MPEDRTVKSFQRLIAPSADATDESDNSASDAVPQGNRELLRRARDILREEGAPMPAALLAQRVFAVSEGTAGVAGVVGLGTAWVPLLGQLLRASSAFACDTLGNWRLTVWDNTAQRLDQIEFIALDIESTGLAPGRHRILEVGAVIVRNGEPGAHFQRLVNPGRRIPQFITRFTGISEAMVKRAGGATEILPRLHEFIDNRPIVGHNIGFDLGFLSYEAQHASLDMDFPLEGIDTIALARRYLTGMRRASLDRVATSLHLPIHSRHRALPDALLTAQVFALLLARAREEGCETMDDLRNAISGVAPVRASLPPGRPTGSMYLNPAWRQHFPTRPGVYLMKDVDGEVIYVGKAKSLRDRLASYYNQPLGYTRKMDGLLQSVQQIETRVLGSELEALLVESRLIKELQPRYNVQLRNYELYPFIKVDIQHPYPRFYATRDVSADGARYFGPFRSTRIVNATLELIQKVFPLRTCTRSLPPSAKPSDPCLRYHLKRCAGPCRGELSDEAAEAYNAAVAEACAFLGGERADLIDRLKREMFEAAARQDFERAARLRDALKDADQVLLGQRLVTGAVEANNLLIVYPSSEPDHIEIFLIRHGRLLAQRRVAQQGDLLRDELRALVAEATALGTPPSRVGRAEVDQINIIARWISHHSEDDERAFFRLPHELDDAATVEAFIAQVADTVLASLLTENEVSIEDEGEDDDAGKTERVTAATDDD
ncbi:MAG TPA: exonuclease domain-containing protein [Ktedonobacterales bacterium]|nr:exonuclease domain-containing protein [Ktedonobacterales bacterium]